VHIDRLKKNEKKCIVTFTRTNRTERVPLTKKLQIDILDSIEKDMATYGKKW
jgi:hypothetical protein